MTNPNLGRQFFHGSPHEFAPGDEVLPSAKTGVAMTRGDSHPDRVFVSEHPFVAGMYTWKYGDDGNLADDPKDGPSGHVYEVEPRGRLFHDPNCRRSSRLPGVSQYTTKGAVVKRRLDPKEWR